MENAIGSDALAIENIEKERCKLISENDIDSFGNLLADDYIHVHVTGRIDKKEPALASFRKVPRLCWRGELSIRLYGDIAIVTGPQTNRMVRDGVQCEDRTLIATTILNRQADVWKIVHFHACSAAQ